jgi:tetratricopeptide (TPR) repeat protein
MSRWYQASLTSAEAVGWKARVLTLPKWDNKQYPPEEIRRHSASIYHQLGRVAQEQRRWEQAEQYYQKVLAIFIEFNDRYEQAGTYHQLGVVAQAQRRFEQAEQYYQKALAIFIEFNDRHAQAGTCHQLGVVAQEQGEWASARDYLLKDLEITREVNDEHGLGITLQSLARLWQASGDAELPQAVASHLGTTPEEVEGWLRQFSGEQS